MLGDKEGRLGQQCAEGRGGRSEHGSGGAGPRGPLLRGSRARMVGEPERSLLTQLGRGITKASIGPVAMSEENKGDT